MKRMFYLSASILMLALAFHFGYTTAKAQAPSNPVVGCSISATQSLYGLIVTANGDVYTPSGSLNTWHLASNIFSGGPTPALQETWGQLKSRFAPKSTPAPTTPTDR
jgi:hypothetical protein